MDEKIRTLMCGAGAAAVAGLLLGGAMQPDLRGAAGPEGPQMTHRPMADRAGFQLFDSFRNAGLRGDPPDYVIGTDWTRPAAYDAGAFEDFGGAYAPPEVDYAVIEFTVPPPERDPVVWTEPAPPEPTAYPSVGGDILAALRPPPRVEIPSMAPAPPPTPAPEFAVEPPAAPAPAPPVRMASLTPIY